MFYVLTSHNIYALERQFETLSKNDTTVIINTLDENYAVEAENYCKLHDIRYLRTESDGTAATGKNSFLDTFEQDGVPYAVLIDGDDYLTKYGVNYYKTLASLENAPDAIVLTNPISMVIPRMSKKDLENPERVHWDPKKLDVQMVTGSSVECWDTLKKGELLIDNTKSVQLKDLKTFQDYIGLFEYGMGIDEIAARVVFMSRKALAVRYNKKFIVGEDTFQYLELKDLAERGDFELLYHDEKRPTYMYDARISGIALTESTRDGGKGFVDWMLVLKNEIQRLKDEGRLHKRKVKECLMV